MFGCVLHPLSLVIDGADYQESRWGWKWEQVTQKSHRNCYETTTNGIELIARVPPTPDRILLKSFSPQPQHPLRCFCRSRFFSWFYASLIYMTYTSQLYQCFSTRVSVSITWGTARRAFPRNFDFLFPQFFSIFLSFCFGKPALKRAKLACKQPNRPLKRQNNVKDQNRHMGAQTST